MARYTGPKSRIARRFGEPIFGPDKALDKRNYAPGQHGVNRRKKNSEYGTQLAEKQKAKYTYGVLERQFRLLFEQASRKKYTGYKKAGEPDQIEFKIMKSPKLQNHDELAVFDRQYEQLQNMMMKHFGFTQREIESLMKRINEQNIQEMITKVSTIYMLVQNDKKGEIKDIKAYVYKAMDNFLNETMDRYEEVFD